MWKECFLGRYLWKTENWKMGRKNPIFTRKIWKKSGGSARVPTKFTVCFGALLFTFGSEKWKNVFLEKWTYLGQFSPISCQTLIDYPPHTPPSIPPLTSSRYLLEVCTLEIGRVFLLKALQRAIFQIIGTSSMYGASRYPVYTIRVGTVWVQSSQQRTFKHAHWQVGLRPSLGGVLCVRSVFV